MSHNELAMILGGVGVALALGCFIASALAELQRQYHGEQMALLREIRDLVEREPPDESLNWP